MKTFFRGYSCAVYVGFVLFVLLNIADHPEPLLFGLLFLTIWPLAGIMMGYEPIIHIEAEHERKNGQKAPARWEWSFRDGLITGIVTSLLSLLCFFQLEQSLWLLAPPVIAAYFGPAVGLQLSLRRLKKARP
jgi:4-hydroxybenzoate polyprenyltransferase